MSGEVDRCWSDNGLFGLSEKSSYIEFTFLFLFSLCFPQRAYIARAYRLLILILNREVWSGSVFSSRF